MLSPSTLLKTADLRDAQGRIRSEGRRVALTLRFSRQELSEYLDVTVGEIGHILTGRAQPSARAMVLFSVLGVPPEAWFQRPNNTNGVSTTGSGLVSDYDSSPQTAA
jgi:transcriptional regulator with XRE-family HTH domain